MQIGALRKLSLKDYPRVLSCVAFLVGCNYRCPFCDSLEFVLPGVSNAKQAVSEKDFFKFLKISQGSIHGVVLTGGEPTVHQELPLFCQKIKRYGFKIKLDTNGSNAAMLKHLVDKKLVDYVAMDVKAPKEKYAMAIGIPNCAINYTLSQIETSIGILKNSHIEHEFCATMTPLLDKKDILSIIQWVKPEQRFRLQIFRSQQPLQPNLSQMPQHSNSDLFKIQQALAPFCPDFQVRLECHSTSDVEPL